MNNNEKKLAAASIKNINRVLLASIILFLAAGIAVSVLLPRITSSQKISNVVLEVTAYTALVLPSIVFFKLNLHGSKDIILPKFNLKTIKNGIICAAIAYPLMMIADYFSRITEISSHLTSNQIEDTIISYSFIGNVIRMALLPAAAEEFAFRGSLFGVYSKKNALAGLVLSSFLFSLLHSNLYQIPYTLVGGIIFAYSTYVTDNTGTAMVGHFIVNLISIIAAYINRFLLINCPDNFNVIAGIINGLIMAGGVLAAAFLIVKVFKKKIVPRSLKVKEREVDLRSFITSSLVFAISILLLITLLYEGYIDPKA